ncbi:hypothetical protein [Pseudoneobacillus sp. C159]
MAICPLCNGFEQIIKQCQCGGSMMDTGRVMDYYDDYSAYMEIDQLKLEDGYRNSYSQHQCPHLFTCEKCLQDEIIFIKE